MSQPPHYNQNPNQPQVPQLLHFCAQAFQKAIYQLNLEHNNFNISEKYRKETMPSQISQLQHELNDIRNQLELLKLDVRQRNVTMSNHFQSLSQLLSTHFDQTLKMSELHSSLTDLHSTLHHTHTKSSQTNQLVNKLSDSLHSHGQQLMQYLGDMNEKQLTHHQLQLKEFEQHNAELLLQFTQQQQQQQLNQQQQLQQLNQQQPPPPPISNSSQQQSAPKTQPHQFQQQRNQFQNFNKMGVNFNSSTFNPTNTNKTNTFPTKSTFYSQPQSNQQPQKQQQQPPPPPPQQQQGINKFNHINSTFENWNSNQQQFSTQDNNYINNNRNTTHNTATPNNESKDSTFSKISFPTDDTTFDPFLFFDIASTLTKPDSITPQKQQQQQQQSSNSFQNFTSNMNRNNYP